VRVYGGMGWWDGGMVDTLGTLDTLPVGFGGVRWTWFGLGRWDGSGLGAKTCVSRSHLGHFAHPRRVLKPCCVCAPIFLVRWCALHIARGASHGSLTGRARVRCVGNYGHQVGISAGKRRGRRPIASQRPWSSAPTRRWGARPPRSAVFCSSLAQARVQSPERR
jgi:hypothetical protein